MEANEIGEDTQRCIALLLRVPAKERFGQIDSGRDSSDAFQAAEAGDAITEQEDIFVMNEEKEEEGEAIAAMDKLRLFDDRKTNNGSATVFNCYWHYHAAQCAARCLNEQTKTGEERRAISLNSSPLPLSPPH